MTINTLAEWAQLSPHVMEEMLSWTGVKAGNVRMEFRGELFLSRALRNPVIRGCPVCLREDAAGHNGPAAASMVMRGDWQMREVTLCVRHSHPLVPLWRAQALLDRYDIAARLSEIEADILSGALDQSAEAATPYDLWLDRRLENGLDNTWLKQQSLYASTAFCRLLGQALLRDGNSETDIPVRAAHAAGFVVACQGEAAIRNAFDLIAGRARCQRGEPHKAFGKLLDKLGREYLEEESFTPFRKILRPCILNHWPIPPGSAVLGETVTVRRLHSVTTAAEELGVGPAVVEHFLKEAGAIPEQDDRPQSRRIFDAQIYAELLAEIPTLVGPIAMRDAMGATRHELKALEQGKILVPRTLMPKVKNPWRISDGLALVRELSATAISVVEDDGDWETLLLSCRRKNIPMAQLVDWIRMKRVLVGQRDGVAGFHAIVVSITEIDAITADECQTALAAEAELSGSMSTAEFGRSVGLRDNQYLIALLDNGCINARRVRNPKTGRFQYRMSNEEVAAFHARFVTLTTLAKETGKHRNTLKRVLPSVGISRFSPGGQEIGPVYLREDFVGSWQD